MKEILLSSTIAPKQATLTQTNQKLFDRMLKKCQRLEKQGKIKILSIR